MKKFVGKNYQSTLSQLKIFHVFHNFESFENLILHKIFVLKNKDTC